MITPKEIAAAAAPLHRVAAQLAQAAGDCQQARPMRLDPDRLGDLIDETLGTLLQDHARRASALQALSVHANRCAGLVERLLSGDTSFSAAHVLGELVSLRGSIGLLTELLGEQDRDREAA
jgi:hypothetical protein